MQPAAVPTSRPAGIVDYLTQTDRLTGDWLGGRTGEDHGLTVRLR